MTGVSWWGHKVDNAYWIWSFQGKLLKRFQTERFCQFLWRPRPPCFLSLKQIRDIKKNLKKYSVEFDAIDKMKISEISKELLEKRQNARSKFDKYRAKKVAEYNSQKAQRLSLRNGFDSDDRSVENQDLEEEVIEFLMSSENGSKSIWTFLAVEQIDSTSFSTSLEFNVFCITSNLLKNNNFCTLCQHCLVCKHQMVSGLTNPISCHLCQSSHNSW